MKTTKARYQKTANSAPLPGQIKHPDAGRPQDGSVDTAMIGESHVFRLPVGRRVTLEVSVDGIQTVTDADCLSLTLSRRYPSHPSGAQKPESVVCWEPTIADLDRFIEALQYVVARARQRPLAAGVTGVQFYSNSPLED
jgi:hypothetical protein